MSGEAGLTFTFDMIAEFCEAAYMLRTTKKFVAVFIAIWLPLFSGNALAMSVAMQTMDGDCHSAVEQQQERHLHRTQTQPTEPAGSEHSDCSQDMQHSDGDCGICHLACCGYMATLSAEMAEPQLVAQSYSCFSTQFESIALTLPDPPPLVLA